MKQLRYLHSNVPPIVVVWYRLVHELVSRLHRSVTSRPALSGPRRHLLILAGVVFTLSIQGFELWLLAQLVDLCIDLMEVWAELATYHFALTSGQPS
jgi:type IV secretory pathway TrbD component